MVREIGQVKWYGGFNNKTGRLNEYGFISHITRCDDLYFHKKDINCKERDMISGAIVSFSVREVNGKLQAVEVDIIDNEKDFEVVSNCALSDQENFWLPIYNKYLKLAIDRQDINLDDLISISIKKYDFLSKGKKSIFLKSLPHYIYLKSRYFRQLLHPEQYMKLCTEILVVFEYSNIIDEVYKYVLTSINNNQGHNDIWQFIPFL